MRELLASGCMALLLAGCSGPLSQDNAILTMPMPVPETDCQIRRGFVTFGGGGLVAQGQMQMQVLTIIGAKNCAGQEVDVPTRQRMRLGVPAAGEVN